MLEGRWVTLLCTHSCHAGHELEPCTEMSSCITAIRMFQQCLSIWSHGYGSKCNPLLRAVKINVMLAEMICKMMTSKHIRYSEYPTFTFHSTLHGQTWWIYMGWTACTAHEYRKLVKGIIWWYSVLWLVYVGGEVITWHYIPTPYSQGIISCVDVWLYCIYCILNILVIPGNM